MPTDDQIETRRARLIAICGQLPEATVRGGQHVAFLVRGKTFAYHLNDHHGDGRVALTCKVAPGENDLLARLDPMRFYIPPYVGPKGWIALRLDSEEVDWGEVADLVTTSYRLIAPRRLAARVDQLTA